MTALLTRIQPPPPATSDSVTPMPSAPAMETAVPIPTNTPASMATVEIVLIAMPSTVYDDMVAPNTLFAPLDQDSYPGMIV